MSRIEKALTIVRNKGVSGAAKMLRRRYTAAPKVQSRRAAALVRKSMDRAVLDAQREHKFKNNPLISILMPVYNTDIDMLCCVIESVMAQTYPVWELCICDASDGAHASVGDKCREYEAADSGCRIKYRRLAENKGIAANTNECADMASGEYLALLDHDDILHPSALYKVVAEIEKSGADFLYTDELTFSGRIGNVLLTNLKPDYSPDTLRGNNYICHFTVFSAELFEYAGKFRSEYDGSQDHDIFLRMTKKAKKVSHIPEILYFWRAHKGSVVEDVAVKGYAVDAGIRAVRDNLAEWGQNADVAQSDVYPTIYRVRYTLPEEPLVSVIISDEACESPQQCANSLKITEYGNYEIILVNGGGAAINECVRQRAKGSFILLLDGSAEATEPDWMRELLQYAVRDDAGAVGTGLFNLDGTVNSYFMITGVGSDKTAVPAGRALNAGDNGYLGRMGFTQNVNALNSACLMVSRAKYLEAGGLDEKLSVTYNRIDLCLRLRELGYNNIYTPFAAFRLICAEDDKEKRKDREETEYFLAEWRGSLRDPYYNVNFRRDGTYLL
ncbi:MAG: glycosyltransferase [Butyrivibrio sp.]|nr:glycosyltransferase [Butyrivibrio sp.]